MVSLKEQNRVGGCIELCKRPSVSGLPTIRGPARHRICPIEILLLKP